MAKPEWVTRDIGWKLFSLILAVGIWLTIHNILAETGGLTNPVAGNRLTYDDLQVVIVSSTADVRDFKVDPPTVAVTVSGSPEVISVLQANQIEATVNVTSIESTKDLTRRVHVSTPAGVTLVSVDPPEVELIIPSTPQKNP